MSVSGMRTEGAEPVYLGPKINNGGLMHPVYLPMSDSCSSTAVETEIMISTGSMRNSSMN
jgi:hypothetical protein